MCAGMSSEEPSLFIPLPMKGRFRAPVLLPFFLFFLFHITDPDRSYAQGYMPVRTSFEDGFGIYPLIWNGGTSYPGNSWMVSNDPAQAYQGSKSILSFNPYSSGGNPGSQITTPSLACDSGYNYSVRFYQKCYSNTVQSRLRATLYGTSIQPLVRYNDSTLANTAYQLRTFTFQVPEDGQYVISFENYTPYYAATGGIYLDSISISKMPVPACNGRPYGGLLVAADPSLCPGDSTKLRLQHYPTNVGNTSRVWQTSTDGGITWQILTGATGVRYGELFSVAALFRVITICNGSGLSDTSNVVTVNKNAPLFCYCKPQYQTTMATGFPFKMMGALWLPGEQSTEINADYNTCFTCTSGALNYFDRTRTVPPVIVYTDSTYDLKHEMNSVSYASYMFKVWVDLNNDAVFQLNEALYYDNTYQGAQTRIMPLTIPAGTPPGLHRMRVLMVNQHLPAPDMALADACGTYFCGETRDYLLNVQTPQIPLNDRPAGAAAITLGVTCTGTPNGTTIFATTDAGEPSVSCSNLTTPVNTVWFKFVAPVSGKVRISTANTSGTLPDTKMMVYAVTNPSSYTTFTPVGCDDDNGSNTLFGRSLLYLARLQAGNTYYIQVSRKKLNVPDGTFCITVDELSDQMISDAGSCLFAGSTAVYGGQAWVSLVDAQGKLVSNVRSNNNQLNTLESPAYIHTGAVRSNGAKKLLNRNWGFELNNTLANKADLQLFFRQSEWTPLLAAAPNTTLGNISIARVNGRSCMNAYDETGTTVTPLTITGQDMAGGVAVLQTQTDRRGAIFLYSASATGIAQTALAEQVRLYPNPVADQLYLELDMATAAALNIEVLDIAGRRLITTGKAAVRGTQTISLPVAGLAPGLYQLRITSAVTGASYNQRFIHQ